MVRVENGLFLIGAPHTFSEDRPEQQPGDVTGLLLAPHETWTHVRAGIELGPVTIELVPVAERPDEDLDGWEDVAEVSLEVPDEDDQRLVAFGFDDAEAGSEPQGRLDSHGPGAYRVRVHARGRDAMDDLAAHEPVETYRIVAWPEPFSPAVLLKSTSRRNERARESARR